MTDFSAQKWAWAGAIALIVAMGIGRFVYTPILPAMAQALSLGHAMAGWIASANFAGYLAGAALASLVKKQLRAAVIAGLFASALTTEAMGAVSSPLAFIVLRTAGGVASAIVLVCGSSLVLEGLQEKGRDGLSALYFAGVGMGIALSAATIWALEGADWRMLWYASGALSLAGSVAVALLLPQGTGRRPTQTAQTARAQNSRAMTPLLAAYGLFGFGYVITATFLVVQVRGFHLGAGIEPTVWLIVGLSAVPSVAAWTWIGARMGLLRAYALASAIEAVGVAASVLWPTLTGALISAFLLGATFVGLTALGLRAARDHAADPPRMIAWMTMSFGVGQIVGPTVAGQLAAHTGNFTLATLIAAATLLLAAALTGFQRSCKSPSTPTARGGA
ncbi:MAG: YbfB/YjiJ family MFS transporter [Rhizomicrobium sp.]